MDDGGPAPGSEVGGYRILAPLGSGGMGTVYRAVDGGGTVVALKLLHPHVGADPVARDRLRREVAALQRLHHPGVAAVLDAEADSTEAFVVTELVDGLTLEEHVHRGGPLPAVELAELADGLRDALGAVHAGGIVHRDLKPGNVMLTARGPVLIDFGIAQAADEVRVTSAGFVVGTPGYLAPELLADGDPSPATDWWGWAAVLAYAATGRAPFGSRPLDAVIARTRAGDVDLAGLDPAVAAPLRAALDPAPARRASPDDGGAGLDAAAAGVAPAPPTQAVTRATSLLSAPLAGVPMDDDTRTRMLAQDGRTRALPVAGVGPSHEPGRATPPGLVPAGALAARAGGTGEVWQDHGGATRDDRWADDAGPYGAAARPGDDGGDEGWSDDGSTGGPGEEVAPYWAPRPRRRTGTVLALALAAIAGAMLYPVATGLALLAGLVVIRTVGTAAEAVDHRRERRGGPARGDVARAVAASPWHLLRALFGLLPSVFVAAAVVVVVGGVLWWALDTGRFVVSAADPTPDGRNGPLAFSGALGVVMLLVLVTVWFGPLTRLTRDGARRTLRGVAPGWSGATVLVTLALAGTGVLLVLLLTGQAISWWPLPGPPVLG